MPEFLTPLIIKKVGSQLWELHEDLIFKSDKYPGLFIAPKGFVTNFASIPRIFWTIYPPVGNYDAAAVIHDGGYSHILTTKDGIKINTVKHVIDNIFYECLRVCKVNRFNAKLMYMLVRRFGNPYDTPWLK